MFEERVPKEEGNDDEDSNEEQKESMIFDKYWDPFLKDFVLKIVSVIISLFQEASFLDVEILTGANERFY